MHTSALRDRHAGEAILAAVAFAVATVVVAALGSLASSRAQDWYESLEKPSFTPPDVTFGIVWTILYVLIGVAGWLAWRSSERPHPTIWWAIQMALNLAWTAVFLGLESPVGGLVVIVPLVAAVAIDVQVSARVSASAGILLFPYLMWCVFAVALNIGVVVLN
jgi:benzodiazapine receptor